ncbi:MAG: single-stranded-DNA-specific exonuclease RecJ [Phycisphaerales bacterium]
MRGMTHRWLMDEPPTGIDTSALDLEPIVLRFLASRGFTDASAIAAYTRPRLDGMHDPSQLPGVERAAERLLAALEHNERVVIYGDYDVDGVCATAILFHMMKTLSPGADVRTYVPHRVDEGYGLNDEAIRELAEGGAGVIVSVDCGITASGPARVARDAGVDLIITDHHNIDETAPLPEAHTLVHPRLPDSVYPYGELCGAGVAYKLAWRLATMKTGGERVGETLQRLLLDLLALAGLATVADIVPLTGENRIIAKWGLARVKSTDLLGLRALLEASGLDGQDVDAEHAGFTLGPRLNACGRLGHAKDAVELFTTDDAARANEIAGSLSKLNDQRRRTETKIFEHASDLAREAGMTAPANRAIVLAHEAWHTGVVGIVCSRLVGAFGRPSILMQRDGDLCKGSARSIEGFNLHAALVECADCLETYGGHDMAAGLKLRAERLGAFTERFTAVANAQIEESMLTPSLRIDCEADLSEFTPNAVRQLLDLGPFGSRNHEPTFLLRRVTPARDATPFGKQGDHMNLHVRDGSREIRFVAWRWGDRREQLRAGTALDIVVRPKLSTWRGVTRLEPEIKDVAFATQMAR